MIDGAGYKGSLELGDILTSAIGYKIRLTLRLMPLKMQNARVRLPLPLRH